MSEEEAANLAQAAPAAPDPRKRGPSLVAPKGADEDDADVGEISGGNFVVVVVVVVAPQLPLCNVDGASVGI